MKSIIPTTISHEKMVTVSKKEYAKLCADQLFLEALINCGVDNWEGYEDAQDLLEQWENEDEG